MPAQFARPIISALDRLLRPRAAADNARVAAQAASRATKNRARVDAEVDAAVQRPAARR